MLPVTPAAAVDAAAVGTDGAASVAGRSSEKKIVYYGWSSRDTRYVREHWREMEKMPFDGIGIGVALDPSGPTRGNGSTGNLLAWQTFGTTTFRLDDFREAIADLRAPAWTRFTENFLPVAIATRDQDQGLNWFDDARWATIENNWRVLLTIARQGGCRGLLLDPEHYDYECELFSYRHHRAQRIDRSFGDYSAQARERGRQLGAAAREIYPDITVGMLYGYTIAARDVASGRALEDTRYALLPAFLDGLLEGSAPEARFVDLWEFGHTHSRRDQFRDGIEAIRNRALAVTANPELYRAKIQAGLSIRIDPDSTGERVQQAVSAALSLSDRYVWIYSEKSPRFFPMQDAFSDYPAAISAAREMPADSGQESTSAGAGPLLPGVLALGGVAGIMFTALPRRDAGSVAGGRLPIPASGLWPSVRGTAAFYRLPRLAAHAIFWSPVLLFALLVAAIALPATRERLIAMMNENQPIELLTFVFLFWAGVLGIFVAKKARGISPVIASFHALLAVALLFVAMEEVAWGQFFFGFATPGWMEQINSQGVVTLHNLRGFDSRTEILRVIFGAAGLAGIWMTCVRPERKILVPAVLSLWFVVILGHSLVDLWNDYFTIEKLFDHLVGELSEAVEMMIGIVALLFVWLDGRRLSTTAPNQIPNQ